ncbi:MAG: hypothetical protein K6A14_01060 [Erysipelotrichaceae bacterium]|nr:hypothetical protein [Erysipelotrichaceae bacterium]
MVKIHMKICFKKLLTEPLNHYSFDINKFLSFPPLSTIFDVEKSGENFFPQWGKRGKRGQKRWFPLSFPHKPGEKGLYMKQKKEFVPVFHASGK